MAFSAEELEKLKCLDYGFLSNILSKCAKTTTLLLQGEKSRLNGKFFDTERMIPIGHEKKESFAYNLLKKIRIGEKNTLEIGISSFAPMQYFARLRGLSVAEAIAHDLEGAGSFGHRVSQEGSLIIIFMPTQKKVLKKASVKKTPKK